MSHSLSPKEKTTVALLAALAVACIIFVLSPAAPGGILIFIMAFPFAQVGYGLRALSLTGDVGNAVAMVLYALLCISPIISALRFRRFKPEDALLPVVSIVLFYVMYQMINPGRLPFAAGAVEIEQAVLGGIVYSLVLAYCVLRVLRLCGTASSRGLGRYMRVILHLLYVLFVFAVFGIGYGQMLAAFAALRAGNIGNEHLLGTTYVFITLRHVVSALPHVLSMWVVFYALRLIEALGMDQYSDVTLAAVNKLVMVCKWALGVSVLSSAGFNVLQLMFLGRLHVVDSNIHFPVTSILFVLGALLLTQFITENKLLKDENDQFV